MLPMKVVRLVVFGALLATSSSLDAAEPFRSADRLAGTEIELLLVIGAGLVCVGVALRRFLRD
jgi:hypothetical protein